MTKYLGHVNKKTCDQKLFKIDQSGHTAHHQHHLLFLAQRQVHQHRVGHHHQRRQRRRVIVRLIPSLSVKRRKRRVPISHSKLTVKRISFHFLCFHLSLCITISIFSISIYSLSQSIYYLSPSFYAPNMLLILLCLLLILLHSFSV